jgi:hypothetical protein
MAKSDIKFYTAKYRCSTSAYWRILAFWPVATLRDYSGKKQNNWQNNRQNNRECSANYKA